MSPIVVKRQPCEVFSRVSGYYRPIKNYNDAKAQEYEDRVKFKPKGA
jgi:anaerobic ribonucleoside-triphosphate reductase